MDREYRFGDNSSINDYSSFLSDDEFLGLTSSYDGHEMITPSVPHGSMGMEIQRYSDQVNAPSSRHALYAPPHSSGFISDRWSSDKENTSSHSLAHPELHLDSNFQRNVQLSNTHISSEAHGRAAYPGHSRLRVNDSEPRAKEHAPRNAHGIYLRPVSELPDIYRGMFKFGVFNAVQSTCFDSILKKDDNMVISAPTGSGKTVLFELAIIRAIEHSKMSKKPVKCVYIAPTKALCTEKFEDWSAKFEPLGFKCAELTGDTVLFGSSAWGSAKTATIIVTTGEKWDSLTRNWMEHESILSQIGLFLVDEVHILNESRGSTLEVVVSRMKFRAPSLRFILVSATVPNISDVARWIGCGTSNGEKAPVFQFGDEFRPCKLTRHVVPVHRRHDQNDFQFAKTLDYKLFQVIKEYTAGRPILIFCPTRKGTLASAEQLLKDYVSLEAKRENLPWARPRNINHLFDDKRLNELAAVGLGAHHAGLSKDDRKMTEELFLKKQIQVLVATSTLAVGINLPAHMVIIKGVHLFQNNESKEYSDLDVMQMLGRAGRPQFDKDGIAVILCESSLEAKYKALAQGQTILESSLNTNLAEHINSEIGLGTITDVRSAKNWLYGSFLYQRMQQNPRYYSLGDEQDRTCQERVDEMVMNSIAQLKEVSLIEYDERSGEGGALRSTPYGEIMSKYYLRRTTMQLILGIPSTASLREILEAICSAEEFNDMKLRGSEKTLYNKLRRDMDIRFELSKVEKTCDKVFLLVQAVLGGVSWQNPDYKNTESQPHLECFSIFKHIPRIAKATVDVAIIQGDGAKTKHALELARCLSAKAWEDRAIVLRQIVQIGEKSIKVLAEHGITSLVTLQKQSPSEIEALLNRKPPFGLEVLRSLSELPQYDLEIKKLCIRSDGGKTPVEVDLSIQCSLVKGTGELCKAKKQAGARLFNVAVILTLTSDMELIDLRRIPSKALKERRSFELTVVLTKPSLSVIVIASSENVAGLTIQKTYKPDILASEYLVPDTRPLNAVEMDLVGLDDDPDFWNMTIDTSESEHFTKALPHSRVSKDVSETDRMQVKQKPAQGKAFVPIVPKGRYSCNHTCKDKTTCRHACCNEGLEEPPKPKKRPQSDVVEKETKTSILQLLDAKKPLKNKSVVDRNDKKMNELNRIHAQAKVEENLQLKAGQRIKLDLGPPRKKKRPATNFDIRFTEIHDGDYERHPSTSDSEDLPASVMSTLGSSAHKSSGLNSTKPTKRTLSIESPVSVHDPVEASPPRKLVKLDHDPKNSPLFLEISDEELDIPKETGAFNTLYSPSNTQPEVVQIEPKLAKSQSHHQGELDRNDELDELDEWLTSNSVQIL